MAQFAQGVKPKEKEQHPPNIISILRVLRVKTSMLGADYSSLQRTIEEVGTTLTQVQLWLQVQGEAVLFECFSNDRLQAHLEQHTMVHFSGNLMWNKNPDQGPRKRLHTKKADLKLLGCEKMEVMYNI